METRSSFNVPVSYFICPTSTVPRPMIMAEWFTLCTTPLKEIWVSYIKAIRDTPDASEKHKLKLLLPAITPSAELWTREAGVPSDQKIKSLSGFMQFDIDLKDNPSITDAAMLRDIISSEPHVACCMLSASGKGVWGLVKIARLDHFRAHYEQLKRDFKSIGITLDPSKGGNPCDLRFYTYDPEAYIANTFKVYDRVHVKSKPDLQSPARIVGTQYARIREIVQKIVTRQINIAPDYPSYLRLGFAFAHEFGEAGRELFYQVCSPSPKFNLADAEQQYSKCLMRDQGKITIGTFFHLCNQVGLWLNE